jgi:CubicO group peptidase (beta-lactamase class C family)
MQSTVRVLTGAAIATMMALAAARPVHAHEGLAREALGKVVSGSEGVAVAGVVVVRRDAKGRERALAQGCAEFAPDGGACARPLAVDMRMRVASVSKFFVAVGALQLVDAGKLDLDADVSTVLGYELRNPAHPTSAITLRQLLAHTSTLRDAERYNIAPPGSLRDLLADAGRFEPAHAPGRHFNYANINFGVIGALIERASGQRFDRFMNENVLAPAGIRAGFNWSGIETTPRAQVVTLYRKRPPDAEVWEPTGPWRAQVDAFEVTARAPSVPNDYVLGLNPTLFSPQGGLRISAKDVARFIDLTLGAGARAKRGAPRVDLKPATRAVLCRPVFDASLAAQPGAVTGNDEGAFYTAFGVGAQPKPIAGRLWCGHFAEAYGLKGGALYDARRRETLVYFVTGYGDDPPLGDKRYPGLDAVEAAAFDAALLLH